MAQEHSYIFVVMSVSSGRGAEAAEGREHVRAARIVQALLSGPLYSFVNCLTDE